MRNPKDSRCKQCGYDLEHFWKCEEKYPWGETHHRGDIWHCPMCKSFWSEAVGGKWFHLGHTKADDLY